MFPKMCQPPSFEYNSIAMPARKSLHFVLNLTAIVFMLCFASPSANAKGIATTQTSNRIIPWVPPGYHGIYEIPYILGAGHLQSLDVYAPDKPGKPRPLVIWIHGGAWRGGDKIVPRGLSLLSRGYVLASINYRLTEDAPFPAQIYDCKAAIRFLRFHAKEYDFDPNRIGVWGESAGAHLASLIGTTQGLREYEGNQGVMSVSSNVQAVCDWFGPTDFFQPQDITPLGLMVLPALFGGAPDDHISLVKMACPALQVGRAPLPPFLIMQGSEDPIVTVHQSQIFYDKLIRAGGAANLIILPDSGHGTGEFRQHNAFYTVGGFFDRVLMPEKIRAGLPTTRQMQ